MKEFKVKLASLPQVREFVAAASLHHCDIEVVFEESAIDAKSILGLVTLDLSEPLTVQYHGEDAAAVTFRQQIQNFIMA